MVRLVRNFSPPTPERSCDFFTVDTVLLRTLYVLVLLEIGSRRILYANCTAHPNAAWVTQQARNLSWEMNQLEAPIKLAIHDRDAKFVDEFDDVLRAEGAKVTLTPFRCPKANAHCERMIKTLCATRRWTGCSSSASATCVWFFASTSITTTASDSIWRLTFTRLSRRPRLGQDRSCGSSASMASSTSTGAPPEPTRATAHAVAARARSAARNSSWPLRSA